MREAMFIKKNVDKWNQYQRTETNDPDETAERFVTLVDDLSYAKTFYPRSKVTNWINAIAANIYQNIFKNKKEKYSRVFTFWTYELPLLFKKYHKVLLFAFLLNLFFTLVGVWGSMNNEDFMRGALSSGYVDKTLDNISSGDPFGIYKSDNPFSMFVTIAMNNIFVAFLMAMGGLTLGIWTLISDWQNSVMLGAFQYMFFAHNLGLKSVLVIWIHGTLEILSFIVASTAGYIISQSILFPGTYKRIDSFKKGVKDALKIMIALVPIFIVAAFFESYVTHLMSNTYSKAKGGGLPAWCSVVILLTSLCFILWYFVFLPIRLHKRGFQLRSEGILKQSS
ncbi:MAG TPA: stage II sporulation protein M [Ferruginibacter sp.]|nr:stage II sporulation protein M [Ferruginibacter sp.]